MPQYTRYEPSFEQARRINLDFVRIFSGRFGYLGGAMGDPNTQLIIDHPAAGIVLDPASEIDKVKLREAQDSFSRLDVPISIEQPFVGDVHAPWEVDAVDPWLYGDKWYPYDSNVAVAGGAPGVDLVLRVYLRPPPQLFTKRPSSSQPSKQVPVPVAETVLARAAIGGRRHVRVSVKLFGPVGPAAAANFRVTGSPGSQVGPLSIFEVLLSPTVNVVAPNAYTFHVDNPDMCWLFLRGVTTAGAPTFRYHIEAQD